MSRVDKMIEVGDLIKLYKEPCKWIPISYHKPSYKVCKYTKNDAPVMVTEISKVPINDSNHWGLRVRVLHQGKIWTMRFVDNGRFQRYFRKVQSE
jgi:hypothetical protein